MIQLGLTLTRLLPTTLTVQLEYDDQIAKIRLIKDLSMRIKTHGSESHGQEKQPT